MGQLHDDPDDQHLRHRGETNPLAVRLVAAALLLFWLGVVVALGLLTGCASLPREQLAHETAYQTLHLVDATQTLDIRHHDGYSERNPIMGRHPSDATVLAYMAAEATAHVLVTRALVDHDAPLWLQRMWHYGSIGLAARTVTLNYRSGVGVRLHSH